MLIEHKIFLVFNFGFYIYFNFYLLVRGTQFKKDATTKRVYYNLRLKETSNECNFSIH